MIDGLDCHWVYIQPHIQKLAADNDNRIINLQIHAVIENWDCVRKVVVDVVV